MEERQFGDAGARLVLEEVYLAGPEVSFFGHVRRRSRDPASLGAGSQAHLRRRSTDPNTGGMGRVLVRARSWTRRCRRWSMREIVDPVLAGPCGRGHQYRGIPLRGAHDDVRRAARCIEFNVRFGDPEASGRSFRRSSGALAPHLLAAAAGRARRPRRIASAVTQAGGSRARLRGRLPGPSTGPADRPVSMRLTRLEHVTVFHSGHGRPGWPRRDRWRPRAHGGRAAATRSRQRSPARTKACRGIDSRACSTRRHRREARSRSAANSQPKAKTLQPQGAIIEQ